MRDTRRAAKLLGSNIELFEGDVTRPETLHGAMGGVAAVIHLVAIISEAGSATFGSVIRQGTVNVVAEAKHSGVSRFLHMSALGARNDPRFGYFEAKWQAEKAVEKSSMNWTIFRPSVIFGPGDEFINTLAGLVKTAPVIPIVGNGRTRFQPVAVTDVAAAFVQALDDPESVGRIYELGGGESYSYEAMLDVIAHQLGKSKPKVHVPLNFMKLVIKLSKTLPNALRPPVTDEQLKMLAIDNITDSSATAELIGRKPLSLEDGIDYIATGKA